jgi:hypothetical protein
VTDATAPTLRPLGVGDIVDRAIGLYRASPGLFLVIAALPYIVLAIVTLGLNLAFVRTTPFTTLPTNVFDPAIARGAEFPVLRYSAPVAADRHRSAP